VRRNFGPVDPPGMALALGWRSAIGRGEDLRHPWMSEADRVLIGEAERDDAAEISFRDLGAVDDPMR
jgi:hypothetical protein